MKHEGCSLGNDKSYLTTSFDASDYDAAEGLWVFTMNMQLWNRIDNQLIMVDLKG